MSEIVSHQNNFAPQVYEYAKSIEALADPVTRRDYFARMSEDDFVDMTRRVASLVRTGNSNQMHPIDGGGFNEFSGQITTEASDRRDKEQLLRDTWQTAQLFLRDNRYTDEEALEYAALTVAGGNIYTHPDMDANGRASRVLSYIVEAGSGSVDDFEKFSKPFGGGWWLDPEEEMAVPDTRVFRGYQPDRIEFSHDSYLDNFITDYIETSEDVATAPYILNYTQYKEAVVRSVIERADDVEIRILVDKCSTIDDDGKKVLDGFEFVRSLEDSEESVTYVQVLTAAYREARADFVHRFLRGMLSEIPIKIDPDLTGRINRNSGLSLPAESAVLPRDLYVLTHRSLSGLPNREIPIFEQKRSLRKHVTAVGRTGLHNRFGRRSSK